MPGPDERDTDDLDSDGLDTDDLDTDGLDTDGLDTDGLDTDLLDDPARLAAADAAGWLRAFASAGAQVREMAAVTAEAGVARLADGQPPRALAIAGTGEAVDLAQWVSVLAGWRSPCPVVGLTTGEPEGVLPAWLGAADLVVIADLGGGPQRPAAALAEAASRRGSAVLGIGRAGGGLHERCTWARAPFVDVPEDRVEGAALWSLLTPVLLLARHLGIVETDPALAGVADALTEAAELYRPGSESFVNPAKLLALQLAGSFPLIVADSPGSRLVADRLRSGLARLAGLPAGLMTLPDGAGELAGCLAGPLAPGPDDRDLFRDRTEPGPRALRMVTVEGCGGDTGAVRDLLRDLLRNAEGRGVPVSSLGTERSVPLERLAALSALADFGCGYLRLGRPDPGRTPATMRG